MNSISPKLRRAGSLEEKIVGKIGGVVCRLASIEPFSEVSMRRPDGGVALNKVGVRGEAYILEDIPGLKATFDEKGNPTTKVSFSVSSPLEPGATNDSVREILNRFFGPGALAQKITPGRDFHLSNVRVGESGNLSGSNPRRVSNTRLLGVLVKPTLKGNLLVIDPKLGQLVNDPKDFVTQVTDMVRNNGTSDNSTLGTHGFAVLVRRTNGEPVLASTVFPTKLGPPYAPTEDREGTSEFIAQWLKTEDGKILNDAFKDGNVAVEIVPAIKITTNTPEIREVVRKMEPSSNLHGFIQEGQISVDGNKMGCYDQGWLPANLGIRVDTLPAG